MTSIAPLKEWRNVTPEVFQHEILPSEQPAVMRGVAAEWPAVKAGAAGAEAMATYLRQVDAGARCEYFYGPPSIKGLFWYRDDGPGFNFERRVEPFADALQRILETLSLEEPPAIYAGAMPAANTAPRFVQENTMPLAAASAVPRIWIGTDVTVSTHYDVSQNIACVVHGRRRFTVFPPNQVANLYVGPLEFTMAGQPASFVRLENFDRDTYPKFEEALTVAQTAVLEPGDAIFIPYMWWHHVQSLERFNVLMNYWWDDKRPHQSAPFVALVHAILTIRDLPASHRAHWKKFFDHFVFEADETTAAHLPPALRGIQAPMNPQLAQFVKAFLQRSLDS